jgi:hypothetical protein
MLDSFLFTLEEFAREVLFLLDTVSEVCYIIVISVQKD